MSSFPSTNNLTTEVLSFCDDAFYNLVEQQCGTVVLEIMQAQDISSVDCLLDINNIFKFLELDSDELVPLKRKVGISMNDGRFVVKQGIIYKVETFLHTLQRLNGQHSSSSYHNPNNSHDLIIPEQLLKKFPFIRTLVIYAKLIENSKIDFTFLNIILNNMIKNFITEERGYRYDTIVRQFASSLYILGGRTAYEFVRLNIPAFLPSVQMIQSHIGASENHLREGLFSYEGARDYFNINQSMLGFCAEDCTAVVPKVTYDTISNTFIGFSLPLDDNGMPILNSYSTESFSRLEQLHSDLPQAKSLSACLIQPLSPSINNLSPYLLSAYGTDNKFESSAVISRWRHMYEECKAKGIRIIGYATDCDSRYLHAMRISLGFFGSFCYYDHPDILKIDLPTSWAWFFMQHEQLYVCVQDPIHICTKLRNRLLSKTATLLLGNQLINIEPLLYIIENFSKLDHALVRSDIDPKDRQNFKSCTKISNDNVLNLLEKVPNAIGISIYLKAIKSIQLAYIEKTTDIMDRIFHAWVVVFIFRLWFMWINSMEKHALDLIFTSLSDSTTSNKEKCNTKRQYFITYQSYFSVEINAHSLIYLAMLVSERQLPLEALHIWLQNSQTCESTFRSARSISSISSAGVNFTILQFLNRINKLSTLQNIKSSINENKLRFPQHHKVSSTLKNTSKSSNTAIISKTDIENSVLNAYKFVTNLFKPLKIKALLRNGQTISIQELSNAVSRRLEDFYITENDDSNSKNADLETGSDDETESSIHNNLTYESDSDEEVDLDYSYDSIHNVNIPVNRGIRLVDNVKEELAHTYFQVIINGDKKYLHKQAACWFLQKDKSSLSSDRISRVRGE